MPDFREQILTFEEVLAARKEDAIERVRAAIGTVDDGISLFDVRLSPVVPTIHLPWEPARGS